MNSTLSPGTSRSRSLSSSNGLRPKGWPGHEVYPGVYVGDLTCALDLKQLQERGITHIITATNRMKPMHVKDLHYLVLDFPDSADQNMVDAFHDAHSFIDEATGAGGKVLVHCMMGQSRSVTVVTSYIMHKENVTEDEALARVRQLRADAKPIDAFYKQLGLYARMGYRVDQDNAELKALRRSTSTIPQIRSSPPSKK